MQVDDCASVKVHKLNLAVILSVQAFAMCNMNIFVTINCLGNQLIWKLVLIKRGTLG
jgi:Na+/glutamate symporter